MIRFSLVCANGHDFESWFASNESYDFQIERDLVTCPHCSVARINKAVMAPAVTRSIRNALPTKQNVALIGEGDAELRKMARDLHAKIVDATVDVGAEFPAEARKIHDGDAPERAIRGLASPDEARALLEDGVSILPLPILPDERG
ncbi:DUF1178 family protein [uncultured Rhodoblastus sp.]|uniref:DUF1178 family protein n=1 Tax=uncultured Rhodoblastus sp. TaxID=543037 RepID=UPI0025CCF1A2|nr:DUF1178 family protein [uncultured Rhodoblastus sp.]